MSVRRGAVTISYWWNWICLLIMPVSGWLCMNMYIYIYSILFGPVNLLISLHASATWGMYSEKNLCIINSVYCLPIQYSSLLLIGLCIMCFVCILVVNDCKQIFVIVTNFKRRAEYIPYEVITELCKLYYMSLISLCKWCLLSATWRYLYISWKINKIYVGESESICPSWVIYWPDDVLCAGRPLVYIIWASKIPLASF